MFQTEEGWILQKIFSEAKITKTPEFFNKSMDFLKHYILEFPEYENKADSLIMRSSELPLKTLSIQVHRIGLEFDEPNGIDEFLATCREVYAYVHKELFLRTVNRFGIRSQWLFPMEREEAERKLASRFIISGFEGLGEHKSTEFKIKLNKSDKNIAIIAKYASIQVVSASDGKLEGSENKGIYVDTDYFIENTSPRLDAHIESSRDIFKKVLQGILR